MTLISNPFVATSQTTTSTGTQNDFVLTAGVGVLYCNNASLLTFTGFAAGYDGQVIDIVSMGAGPVDVANQNASSSAANRVINNVTGTISLAAGVGRVRMRYDLTTARWRVLHHEQGTWITPTYAGADYTASSGTWTVDSGDVTTCAFWLKGRTLFLQMIIVTSSVSATPTDLRRALPNSYTVAKTQIVGTVQFADNSGTFTATPGLAVGVASDAFFKCFKDFTQTATWTASTNLTNVRANVQIEVA